MSRRMSRITATLVLGLASSMSLSADRVTGPEFVTRSEVMAPGVMAATSQPLATQIALEVMRKGGNAIDAAIAANAALGLMEPTGCGIGGDLFAIVWDAQSKELHGLNASGRSPRGLSLQWFKDNDYQSIPRFGPLPVSVPGAVDGWFELHGRFGRLPMKDVLAPAIRYAREGFPVTEVIAHYWALNAERIGEYPGFAAVFLPGGRAPKKGEIFRNPALADTYEKIAAGGRDAFYKGEIARTIADYMQANGGFLSYEDLATHSSDWVEPVAVNYRGYDVWQLPPNGQGIAGLQILQLLEGYDVASMGFGSADFMHLFVEAKKLAFEDRARFYADPDFMDVSVAKLISDQYADARRALIDPEKAAAMYPHGDPEVLRDGDTIYLTVADAEGNMVSLIQSNYRGMGSGMTPPGLGFVLQDRGEMFSLDPAHPNAFAPGKRPFHTIIPAFVTKDGEPWLSFGVMGGGMQPQGHAQVLVNMIDFGMDLQAAGDAPRIRHDGSSEPTGERMTDGGVVRLERGFPPEAIAELERRGHRVEVRNDGGYGGYQAIRKDEGSWTGASESRKDGHAAGY
ncbi:gamma-glutamyltransferase [Thioalkalivibrio sp. XN279]|uniref:gamma-glutamyltransferase n=1 Tax=Thioalkalivibrio sp. XN279 TaxID=2714953 RepID=UPI00140E07A9|nr:gamma-glutamyltransferase [Thioalkalivibrio sp. XN279]NHA15200.1 gamma-glutamyltransferase [Thioalkalivibrio sp. XN279]